MALNVTLLKAPSKENLTLRLLLPCEERTVAFCLLIATDQKKFAVANVVVCILSSVASHIIVSGTTAKNYVVDEDIIKFLFAAFCDHT